MEFEDFEKHKNFLLDYALKNNIVFRVSRKSVHVGIWERPKTKGEGLKDD